MTKTQARAIVACHDKIQKALDVCLAKLTEPQRQYASEYWAAHIESAIGSGYGSMPYLAAVETLEAEEE